MAAVLVIYRKEKALPMPASYLRHLICRKKISSRFITWLHTTTLMIPSMGLDYQILVKADFLVNLYEQQDSPEGITSTLDRIFKTQMRPKLCETLFAVNKPQKTV